MTPGITNAGLASDLDIIDRYLSIDGKFLVDAGCGDMHLSKALASRGARVLAIEPDPVQAKLNKQAPVTANVGFAECGAENIPVENISVDGVLFPYSLHHVPVDLHAQVFDEVLRVLKPTGFVYVLEPVAEGKLNSVMQIFHDERKVRQLAQATLDNIAAPRFNLAEVITYNTPVSYGSWEEFASHYSTKSYNNHYTEADIRSGAAEEQFLKVGVQSNFSFESPKRVTLLSQPLVST